MPFEPRPITSYKCWIVNYSAISHLENVGIEQTTYEYGHSSSPKVELRPMSTIRNREVWLGISVRGHSDDRAIIAATRNVGIEDSMDILKTSKAT